MRDSCGKEGCWKIRNAPHHGVAGVDLDFKNRLATATPVLAMVRQLLRLCFLGVYRRRPWNHLSIRDLKKVAVIQVSRGVF